MYFYRFFLSVFLIKIVNAESKSFFQFSNAVNNLRIQRSFTNLQGVDFRILNESLETAMWLAFENCRLQTKWERWNCPEQDFYRQDKMLVTKEQAFMESLSAASIMHTLLLYCFQGKFHQCKCFKERKACVSQCSQTFNKKSLLKFGVKVVDTFLKQKNEDRVRMHNRRIGIKIVKKSLIWKDMCKSEARITSFNKIAELLKTYWKTSTRLDLNTPWFVKSIYAKKFFKNTLIYVDESPNFCRRNDTLDILGTEGRICLTKKLSASVEPEHTEACHRLCFSCGYFVTKKMMKIEKQCRCR